MPDLSELISLLTLYHLCKEIENIYAPGTQIRLFTQEPFLCHMSALVSRFHGVPLYYPGEIERYQSFMKELVKHFSPTICIEEIPDLQNLYNTHYSHLPTDPVDLAPYHCFMKKELTSSRFRQYTQETFDCMFRKLVLTAPQFAELAQYAQKTYAEFRELASNNSTIPKRLFLALHDQISVKKAQSFVAYELAECYVNGAARLRLLYTEHIPAYSSCIRLSVRKSADTSIKLGIQLIFACKGTPWHAVLFLTPDMIELQCKEEIKHAQLKEYPLGDLRLPYMYKE